MTKKTALVGALVVVILGAVVVLLLWLRTSDGPVLVLKPKNDKSLVTETWLIAPTPQDTPTVPVDGGSLVSGTDRRLRRALMRPVRTLTCDGKASVVGLKFYNTDDVNDKEKLTAELNASTSKLTWLYYDAQGNTGVTKAKYGGGKRTLPSEFLRLVNHATCRFASEPNKEVSVKNELRIEFRAH